MSQKEIFIEKCHKKYGDFYDYSKVEYKNCKTKVCIICPKHGEFFVTPDNFLNNNRTCSKCKFEERVNLFQIFENKIKEKFGDKYDLSFVEYKNCKEEVCIICKKCGNKFYITPDYFLSSNGCPICKHKIAEEKLYKNKINKFEKYFNDNFNGKLKFISYDEKQHIIHYHCYVHGEQEFHLNKYEDIRSFNGCKKCEKDKKQKELIEKIRNKFGNLYDLSKVEFTDYNTKICLICSIHGEFWITPYKLFKSKDICCEKCILEHKANEIRIKKEQFIEKAKKIHIDENGNPLYDYSKVEYKNAITNICIICKKHGEFWQTPNNHLKGKKCPKCAGKYKTTSDVIEEFKDIFGDKYDYSKVVYKSAKDKIIVICPKHGEFLITPNKHLQGRGCPKCKNSYLENDVEIELKQHNIDYIKNYYNKDLFGSKKIDFYLPKQNIAIECQGIQHFKTNNNFLFGLTSELLERDINKNKECNKNNITIIYYTYGNVINQCNLNDEMFCGIYSSTKMIIGKKELHKFFDDFNQ